LVTAAGLRGWFVTHREGFVQPEKSRSQAKGNTYVHVTGYATCQEALAGLDQWVRYLNDGGTVEEWREHNRAQAWIAWHQDWRRRMAEHAEQVKRWLKDHPEGKPYAEQQFKQACLEWAGAATLEAAQNPELVDYAAKCGEVIMDTLKRQAEAQKGKP
jgi:hypothetical protein